MAYAETMSSTKTSSTDHIVQALTQAVVEHRLQPGAKLVEQALADHFGVSRTLVRQALFQLSQKRLVELQPGRGAFVASPSAEEARQVFAVRRMLELELTREFVRTATPDDIQALREHVASEKQALAGTDVGRRTDLLSDFHVLMAERLGNAVLGEVLRQLLARSTIATLMYQSSHAAEHSSDEHAALVDCFASGDVEESVRLMREHLDHVEAGLNLDAPPPTSDIRQALSRKPRRRRQTPA